MSPTKITKFFEIKEKLQCDNGHIFECKDILFSDKFPEFTTNLKSYFVVTEEKNLVKSSGYALKRTDLFLVCPVCKAVHYHGFKRAK